MLDSFKLEGDDAIERCKEELKSIGVARANPSLVQDIVIDAYGVETPLQQLASISAPDARTLVIAPWDKGVVQAVETGIRNADLGINPVNEGEQIRMVIPQVTEERRLEYVKSVHKKIEEFRVRVRQARDKAKDAITKAEKDKEFGEDEKFRLLEQLDKETAVFNDQLKSLGDAKEKDIMTI